MEISPDYTLSSIWLKEILNLLGKEFIILYLSSFFLQIEDIINNNNKKPTCVEYLYDTKEDIPHYWISIVGGKTPILFDIQNLLF